jgi:MerR family transcriptional regulator, mercuric resistance operon regulatory protein
MRNMTIGDLAKASGVHLETIRYYERIGLIRKPERTTSGYRSYKAADLERLQFIRCARELGFGIEKVRALLTLQNGSKAPCEQVRGIAQEQIEAIDAKVARLLALRTILVQVVDRCPANPSPTDACPILEYMATCGTSCAPSASCRCD